MGIEDLNDPLFFSVDISFRLIGGVYEKRTQKTHIQKG